ncbi:hypothetical protein X777_14655 [Ooceraea biroi]|uniref:Tc1-like transposase DDE domain-containing protein n=1 Tax=Ooceraea biroi TaxID=2015173 RepID=A0A026VW35_OOCBI|nr:hypothetical protein X777_14655 [Ooceraea biroi]
MWMQQNGCPAHYSLVARNIMDRRFPGRWIGRGSYVAWPARSPDLTPMDYFFWGWIKNIIYQQCSTTREDMKERIRNACQSLSDVEVLRATDNIRERIRFLLKSRRKTFRTFVLRSRK